MMLPKIIYDLGCPVCTNYMRLVRRKIEKQEAEISQKTGKKTVLATYEESSSTSNDFEYVDANGKSFLGTAAIDAMAKDFPYVKDYMWMLPPAYKTIGLKAAYKVGSIVRKAIGVVRKGCNCGKKR